MRNIIVDTGPLVALFHKRDRHHQQAKQVLALNRSILISTWPVVTEACHFLTQTGKRAVLEFIGRAALTVKEMSVNDVVRLGELLAKYPTMDFADASLVLLAEKTGITDILTIDRVDFEVYRTKTGRRFRNWFK